MDNEKKYKILIIEDEQLNQEAMVNALQDSYTLYTVSSGEAALKTVGRFHPHLILLDIVLPDINGFEILKRLKESLTTQNIPVLIITGLDNDKDEQKGLSMGAVDYIRKPFNAFLVKARVDIHIQIAKQLITVERLSFFDALTDLPNRRRFDYHLEYEWRRAIRKKTSIGMMMMDLDHFKEYNDCYGHTQGDVMLKAAANVLKSTLARSTDISCRWGGEEFAVLIPETSEEDLLFIAEKIRARIEALKVPNIRTNELTSITISIGAACMIPDREDQVADFVEMADQLLYKAKNAGRNQISTNNR